MKIKACNVIISNTPEAIEVLGKIFEYTSENLIFYSQLFSSSNVAICVRVSKDKNMVFVNKGRVMYCAEDNTKSIDMPITHSTQIDCPFTLMTFLDVLAPIVENIGADYVAEKTTSLIRGMARSASDLVIIE